MTPGLKKKFDAAKPGDVIVHARHVYTVEKCIAAARCSQCGDPLVIHRCKSATCLHCDRCGEVVKP